LILLVTQEELIEGLIRLAAATGDIQKAENDMSKLQDKVAVLQSGSIKPTGSL